jgi:hypothetical protein
MESIIQEQCPYSYLRGEENIIAAEGVGFEEALR